MEKLDMTLMTHHAVTLELLDRLVAQADGSGDDSASSHAGQARSHFLLTISRLNGGSDYNQLIFALQRNMTLDINKTAV